MKSTYGTGSHHIQSSPVNYQSSKTPNYPQSNKRVKRPPSVIEQTDGEWDTAKTAKVLDSGEVVEAFIEMILMVAVMGIAMAATLFW